MIGLVTLLIMRASPGYSGLLHTITTPRISPFLLSALTTRPADFVLDPGL